MFTYGRQSRVEDITQSVANLALHFGDDDSKVIFFVIFKGYILYKAHGYIKIFLVKDTIEKSLLF